MKLKQKQGISLIVMVITIIVMIILAAAIILSLNGNNIIGRASDSAIKSDLQTVKEQFAKIIADKMAEENSSSVEIDESVLEQIDSKYREYFGVEDGKLYIKDTAPSNIKRVANELKIDVYTNFNETTEVVIGASEGAILQDYKIYGQSVQNGTPTPENPIEVKSLGENSKNLINGKEAYMNAPEATLVTKNGRQCIRYITASNKELSDMDFKPGTQYTLSGYFKCERRELATQSPHSYDTVCRIYYTNGSYKDFVVAITEESNKDFRKIVCVSAAGATIDRIIVPCVEWRNYVYVDINTIQLEEGNTATEYKPYNYIDIQNEDETYNIDLTGHEPLRKIGDYADYIDYKNSRIVRNVKKLMLNGTENWILWAAAAVGNTKAYYVENTSQFVVDYTGLNTHYSTLADNYQDLMRADYDCWTISNNVTKTASFLYIRTNKMSVNDLKSWLAEQYNNGTPVTIYYVLETPTYEAIDLPTIQLNKGKNNLTVKDANIYASNVEIKY